MSGDFFAVARRQRACRSFADRPVDDAAIESMLEAATWAPSAENSQPWEFIVVRSAESRATLSDLARRAWEGGAADFERERLSPSVFSDVEEGMTGGFATAPVWIVVCGDEHRTLPTTIPESTLPAVQNLLLAATALGLGTTLTTIVTAFRDELAALLELPDHLVPVAAIPVGHPAKTMRLSSRTPAAERTHLDRYSPKFGA